MRNLSAPRDVELADGMLTRDAHAVVSDPDIDLVVEVIGGIEPARELILEALANGKPVVTANKELLANVGAELFAAADAAGVDLLFEAAVAGGIPIMRALRESLLGEPISRVLGIVNGTTNFILTKMTEAGADYATALAEAQRLGYAERDPTADVEGFDAGAKAAIIATIAFGAKVVAGDVYHEGISRHHRRRHRLRRTASATSSSCSPSPSATSTTGEIGVRVHPAMVPIHHPLAAVRESFNAVFVEGDAVGSLMFYGRGAGGAPTASAVLGDVIDAAVNLRSGTHGSLGALEPATIRPIDETSRRVPAQPRRAPTGPACCTRSPACSATTACPSASPSRRASAPRPGSCSSPTRRSEADVQATLRELRELDVVRSVGGLLRVIGEPEPCATSPPAARRPSSASPTSCSPGWPPTAGSTCPSAWPTLAASIAGATLRRARRRGDAAVRRAATSTEPRSRALCAEAYATFRHPAVVPLVQLDHRPVASLELFHGPTLAFKDVALQLVGRLFDHVLGERGERVTIVGATSGDTGSAAIDGVAGLRRTSTSSSSTRTAASARCSAGR